MRSPRRILLRRPPVLAAADGPFVPEHVDLDEVDRRWAAKCAANPACFDGRLLHVAGVHRNGYGGATLHVVDGAYRFHAVHDGGFDTGVRPLGVKGITHRRDRILLGRRGPNVLNYAGQWEFAPGGVVEPGDEPADTLLRELAEETGLTTPRVPTAVALLYDDVIRCWELVYRLEIPEHEALVPNPEYDALDWFSMSDLPAPLTPVAREMVPLVAPDLSSDRPS